MQMGTPSVPFDLRLAPPAAARPYPYTSLVNATGALQPAVEPLVTFALALEGGLASAVILSLFTDARAGADDRLPRGADDRRGWVGAEYLQPAHTSVGVAGAEPWGSRLWLLATGKATDDVLERARFAAAEALDWLMRDGLAERVDVATQWVAGTTGWRDRLAIRVTIWQPDQVAPVYDVLWGAGIQWWAQA